VNPAAKLLLQWGSGSFPMTIDTAERLPYRLRNRKAGIGKSF